MFLPIPLRRVLLVAAACTLPLATQADEPPSIERQAELETLLYQDCGSCHGMKLRGGLGPALPRDRMQSFAPEALAQIIQHGIPGSAMPGWKALLSETEAHWLADHLQTDNRLKTLDD